MICRNFNSIYELNFNIVTEQKKFILKTLP